MLVKTLLPFVLAALAVNAHPVLPTNKTPADVKDAVLNATGGNPIKDATGQRRDVPEPPVKGTHVDQALPVGQAPAPHDRVPKKAQLPASPPSTPVDGKAPQVVSRGFVTKPAPLDEVDPMSERNSALGVEHGAAQSAQAAETENAPAGTRNAKTPVPVPPPAPASAPAAPAPAPAPPTAVKNVAGDKFHSDDEQEDSDSDTSDTDEDPVERRGLPVVKPPTPVKNVLPVRDGAREVPPPFFANKVPSAVSEKSQKVPAALPHAVPRAVEAPEVKSRSAPVPQGAPPVPPKADTPTVTAPQEEKPTVPASEVQPTSATNNASDVPSAPTNAVKNP